MSSRRFLIFVWLVLALAGTRLAWATSVIAPSFAELVDEAQTIVRGKVIAVRCAWADSPQGRLIKTYVTFAVEKRLKGSAPDELVLQFLGGEVDGEGMTVQGMPRFTVGQAEILFVAGNGVRFCPLVGMMHGRYRVMTDATSARDYMARDDGVPLEHESDVQLPQGTAAASRPKRRAAALTPAAFEERITAEVAHRALP